MKWNQFIGVMLMGGMINSANAVNFETLDWNLAKKSKNLTVEVAEVEGSNIKAFKAISTYDTSVENLVSAITDMPNFASWMDGAEEASVIKKIDANTQACYFQNNVPWPFENRDGVIVQSVDRSGATIVTINLSLDNALAPEREGVVRMSELDGAWILENVGENKTKLTYQMHLDPTGEIPQWVVNTMLTGTPKATLKNLHKFDFSRYGGVQPELLMVN